MHRTVIVGGGPAGLAGAFWRLHDDPAADVRVLEAAPRVGGWVRTETSDGYRCEVGPQAVRPGPELDALVAALGIADRLVPAAKTAKTRWIGRGGRLLAVPHGPVQLLRTPLLTLRGKLRLFREPFVAAGDPTGEALSSFVARRFGPETAPLVQAMVSGIFAGDADRLEVEGAFPMLATAEREHGSVVRGLRQKRRAARATGAPQKPKPAAALFSFANGMQELVDALAARLGDRVRTGAAVRGLARTDAAWRLTLGDGSTVDAEEVVLACPSAQAARIVRDLDGELATALAAIPSASLASVYLGFPATALPPQLQGFGFLLEPGERCPALGAIYVGSLFPQHAPAGQAFIRVMLGGRRHPDVVALGDDDLVRLAVDTVARYTGARIAPTFQRIVRVRDAIPQYESGHVAAMARIDQRLQRHPGLRLRGNSYRAIALAGQLGRQSGSDSA